MSIESAKAFLERIKNDEDWRNKLQAAENKEERLAMAKAEGFDFTEEEFQDVRSQLSDEEMHGIAGGDCTNGEEYCTEGCRNCTAYY